MKYYGIFKITVDRHKAQESRKREMKDIVKAAAKLLNGEKLDIVESFIVKAVSGTPVKSDKSALTNALFQQRTLETYGKQFGRNPDVHYKTVIFIHECDEFGTFMPTKRELAEFGVTVGSPQNS